MKVLLFCSNKVGVLLIQSLLNQGQLAGVVIPKFDFPGKPDVLLLSQFSKFPLREVTEQDLKSKELVAWIDVMSADLILVKTFPYLLSEKLLEQVKFGGWNFHASSLPKYRGPAPLFWQIYKGKSSIELCLHKMTAEFDAGGVFARRVVELHEADTHATALNRIAQNAPNMADFLIAALQREGDLELEEQDLASGNYQKRPGLDDITIDWKKMKGEEIANLVRACNPSLTGAMTWFRGMEVRFSEAKCMKLNSRPELEAGSVVGLNGRSGLYLVCSDASCLDIQVVVVEEAICSGTTFRDIFQVQNGEAFQAMPV